MRLIKNENINNMRLCLVFLMSVILVLIPVASASLDKDASDVTQSSDVQSVKEEIAGVTKDGDLLIKGVIVHYKDKNDKVKPIKPSRPSDSGSGCYKLLGYKWYPDQLPVKYVINPGNPFGLTQDFITSTLYRSTETWDNATSTELFSNTYQLDPSARWGIYDGRNSMVFGNNYADSRAIAVTTYWRSFMGKRLLEFDISFETDYTWGDATIDPSKMDLQNIAVHEIGHGIGLADLYNSCTQETMYGYSGYGETRKRDLNSGDISGLQNLYGS